MAAATTKTTEASFSRTLQLMGNHLEKGYTARYTTTGINEKTVDSVTQLICNIIYHAMSPKDKDGFPIQNSPSFEKRVEQARTDVAAFAKTHKVVIDLIIYE
jgi:hypothetical protein